MGPHLPFAAVESPNVPVGSKKPSKRGTVAWLVDDVVDSEYDQSFVVPLTADEALDRAEEYLDGAGRVTPAFQGRMDRFGKSIAVHHGRIETRITAKETSASTRIDVHRVGQAPLEDTRKWLYAVGLGGFLIAIGLTMYNERATNALPPLLTVAIFLLAVVLVLAVLFVADRSLERRSESLLLSLEDAMRGDPIGVLRREIDALERSSSLANGLIFYCASLILEFLIFVIVLSDGVRDGINEAAALDALRFGLLIPIAPALLFAGVLFVLSNRRHEARFARIQ